MDFLFCVPFCLHLMENFFLIIFFKQNFWGKQGVLRVITYTKKQNMPKGHVALWDCNHFHEAQDWMAGHSLITVEFWQSPGKC